MQGVNAEGAIAYHYTNRLWWEKHVQVDSTSRAYLVRQGPRRHLSAPEEIAHATRPDGHMVSIGDTDGGSRTSSSVRLRRTTSSSNGVERNPA